MLGRFTDQVVDVAIDQIQGYFRPTDAERAAAWELLVELTTRTTVVPLNPDEGSLREALTSIHSMFETTRNVLREHGVETATARADGNLSLAVISVRVLNDVLRPVTSYWHPLLKDYEDLRPDEETAFAWERKWPRNAECRRALVELRGSVRAYIDTLARIAGAEGFSGATTVLAPSAIVPRTPVPGTVESPENPRRRMVGWLDLLEMLRYPRARWQARANPSPPAGATGGAECESLKPRDDGSVWIDYVADMGDAFDPTAAVAWQIAQRSIDLPRDPRGELPGPPGRLPSADLLIFGGDQVYPWAGPGIYENQVVQPYRLAAAADDAAAEAQAADDAGPDAPVRPDPAIVAIPGNHDWLGGIRHFDETFVSGGDFAGRWKKRQRRRYFSIKVAANWHVWGFDTKLDNRLDQEQRDHFTTAASNLHDGDRVILCTPVPLWQLRAKDEEAYAELRTFLDSLFATAERQIPLYLSGDSHIFAHYERIDGPTEEHHLTSGGGGAFLQPTHNLAQQIPYESGNPEFRLAARWPTPTESRSLSPGARILLDRRLRLATLALALVHLLFVTSSHWRDWELPFSSSRPLDGFGDAVRWVTATVPNLALLLLVLVVSTISSKANSHERSVSTGALRYGFALAVAQATTLVVFGALAWWETTGSSPWTRYVLIPLVGGVASMAVFLAGHRWINDRIRASDNLAFSVGALTRYKHFIRLRIDAAGGLTAYVVGLDPVGVGWWEVADGGTRMVPPFDPAGTPRLHHVWGLELGHDGRTPATAPTPDPQPADPSLTDPRTPAEPAGNLTVYVAWHPDDRGGRQVAEALLVRLSGDPEHPAAPRLGVPVRFRTTVSGDHRSELADIEVPGTSRAVVVTVAGDRFLSDRRFRAWARRVEEVRADNEDRVRVVVVAHSDHAFDAVDLFGTLSQLRRIDDSASTASLRAVEISALTAVADLLATKPGDGARDEKPRSERPRVFISHAKADGAPIARALHDRLAAARLDTFFDAYDIVEGHAFDEVILTAIGEHRAALVAVLTDAYPSREWCRREALEAKRCGAPLVVIDAVATGHERSFPYLGNVPVIRLGSDRRAAFDEAIVALASEVVGSHWFHQRSLPESGSVRLMPRPPELVTLEAVTNGKDGTDGRPSDPPPHTVIHPDPPLARAEVDLLRDVWPELELRTPTSLTSGSRLAAPEAMMRVAVSISDPPESELTALGLSNDHVRLVFIDLATHLLAAGHGLAYGGDLRFSGFTSQLFDLVRAYPLGDRKMPPEDERRIVNYLAASIHDGVARNEPQKLAEARNVADIVRVEVPAPTAEPQGTAVLAAELTEMRRRSTNETEARLVLGGAIFGSQGVGPGIVEEAYQSVEQGKPLYVIGGFGGAAGLVASAIWGDPPLREDHRHLLMDWQPYRSGEERPSYEGRAADYRATYKADPETAAHLIDRLTGARLAENGLDDDENRLLARTDDPQTIVSLVMRGLAELRRRAEPEPGPDDPQTIVSLVMRRLAELRRRAEPEPGPDDRTG